MYFIFQLCLININIPQALSYRAHQCGQNAQSNMLLIRLPFSFFYFLSIAAALIANISIKFAMISQYSQRVDPSALMNVIFL